MKNNISIITPTYNRAYILDKLYKSLCNQTNSNFEWIIIDDGSKDDTKELVEKIIANNNKFSIKYFYQENGGKHRAVNNGVSKAKYDYIFIVDSDDILINNAIEKISGWIEETMSDKRFAAVAGLKGKITDNCIVGNFPKNKKFIDAKNTDRRKKNLLGDKAEIYRKELLIKNPFKEFEGEKFISEDSVWNELSYQGYLVRWYNEIIYLCEYLEDGLTKAGDQKDINNYKGFTFYTLQRIKCCGFINRIFAIGRFYYISIQKGKNIKEISHLINKRKIKIYFCYNLWKIKEAIKKWKK